LAVELDFLQLRHCVVVVIFEAFLMNH